MKVTKNLNLNIPERNDSVRVIENITENFEKIDEDVLPKGTIPKDWDSAEKIKSKVEEKVSKTGDILSGVLKFTNSYDIVSSIDPKSESNRFSLGYDTHSKCLYLYNNKSQKYLRLYDNGEARIDSSDLNTSSKEVIGAINELFNNKWEIKPKPIGQVSSPLDLNDIYVAGFYVSNSANHNWINTPEQLDNGAFELIVTGITPYVLEYTTQILKTYYDNQIFIRTQTSYDLSNIYWTPWVEIISQDSKWFKGTQGVDTVQYIQDSIIKEKDKGYIDKTTGKPYRCIKQAPSNISTPNAEYFTPADNISNSKSIGRGQKYYTYRVGVDRKIDTNYINDTGNAIVVYLTSTSDIDGGSIVGLVDGVAVIHYNTAQIQYAAWNLSFIVPPGSTYRVTNSDSSQTIQRWVELR